MKIVQKLVIKLSFGVFFLSAIACQSVKPYQKAYIEDERMKIGNRLGESSEISAESYREGASGANGSKAGGGCGCN